MIYETSFFKLPSPMKLSKSQDYKRSFIEEPFVNRPSVGVLSIIFARPGSRDEGVEFLRLFFDLQKITSLSH